MTVSVETTFSLRTKQEQVISLNKTKIIPTDSKVCYDTVMTVYRPN